MDPSAQTPPADQASAPGAQPPAPSPEDQAAAARGDIPMPVTTNQQAIQVEEADQLQKIQEVKNAENINNQQTQNDIALNKTVTAAQPAATSTSSDSDPSKPAEEAKPAAPDANKPGTDPKTEEKSAESKPTEQKPEEKAAETKPAEEKPETKPEEKAQTSSKPTGTKDKVGELQKIVDNTGGMPPAFVDLLNERLERLRLIGSSAGLLSTSFIMELESTTRYIDWSTKLPWDKKTEDVLDLAKAKAIMDKNHFGLEPLKQRVLEYIATVILNLKNNGDMNNVIKSPILCVVGLAGTGKTTFAKSLGETLGRSTERIPFGGMSDSRVLRGQSRYFPDAEPGAVMKHLVHAQAKNPVILLDEVDRVTDTARADIMGVLIEILDPEQNAAFTDHYIDYPFSLQNVLFIATANNVSGVATAVLDRFEIIHMPSYNDEEKIHIGKFYVLPKSIQLTGLHPDQLTVDEDVWEGLVRPLGYDPGVRGLDRLITNICRKAATMIVTGQATNVRVTNDNVKSFLPEW